MPPAPALHHLAHYHVWATERLICAHLQALDEAQWQRPMGLFFSSIAQTLNHLLLGDRVWWGRFTGAPLPLRSLREPMAPDRPSLVAALRESVRGWPALLEDTPPEVQTGMLRYQRINGQTCCVPWIGAFQHVVNHGTHHRGQISAALTAMGLACPELDLIYMLLEDPPMAHHAEPATPLT